MSNERMPGSTGEQREQDADLEHKVGENVVRAYENGVEEVPLETLGKMIPKRENETNGEWAVRLQRIKRGELPIPQTVEVNAGKYQELPLDRRGTGISEESLQRLNSLNFAERQRELDELNRNQQLAIEAARAEGYRNSQLELAKVLDGKTPEVRLQEMAADLERLEADVAVLEQEVYIDGDLKAARQRWLEQAKGDLASYRRKYEMVSNLTMGENAEAVDPNETFEQPQEVVDTRATMLDTNEPILAAYDAGDANYDLMAKKRRAQAEAAFPYLSEAEREKVRQRLDKQEAKERELAEQESGDFASEDEEATDEAVRATAEAAARSQMGQNPNYRSTTEADHRKHQQDYREALGKWSDDEKKGRFGDVIPPEPKTLTEKLKSFVETRAERLKSIGAKVKSRIPFKKLLQSTVVGLVVTMLVSPAVKNNALAQEAGSHAATEMSTDVGPGGHVESDDSEEAWSDAEIERAAARAADAVIARAEAEESYANEVWSRGNDLYEGFMEDENSQMMENGVASNFSLYESSAKHSKNSYGPSVEADYGNQEKTKANLVEMIKSQPQAMASFMATYPRLLTDCGVGEEITGIKNVEERANAVLDLLVTDVRGGDWQKMFLGAADLVLGDENTEYNFYEEYGLERTFYMKQADPSQRNRPDNISLKTDVKQRHGDKQVQITFVYPDGTMEVGDFNLGCGLQTNLDKDTYEVRVAITPETQEIENVTVVVNQPVQNEVKVETTDSTPEPEQPTPEPTPTPTPTPEPEPEPEEKPEEKNPDKGEEIWDNGDHEGEAERTEDVGDTGVGETGIEDDMPEQGNAGVVDEGSIDDSAEDRSAQDEADEAWKSESGMADEEKRDEIDDILRQAEQRSQNSGGDTASSGEENS